MPAWSRPAPEQPGLEGQQAQRVIGAHAGAQRLPGVRGQPRGQVDCQHRAATLHGALPEAAPMAPAQALSPRTQAAVIAWAGRSTRITEARLAELAQLAAPATGVNAASRDAVLRLLSVANWLMGEAVMGKR